MNGSSMRLTGRSQRVLASVLVVVLAAAVVAIALPAYSQASPVPFSAFAHGSLSQGNSTGHSAILGARGLLPGQSTSGSVVITNTGAAAVFYLTTTNLIERAGGGGGRFSEKLVLTMTDITDHARPQTLYRGIIGDSTPVLLGVFQPGDAHTYRLTMSFPEGGSADNAFQGGQLSVQFDWTAVAE